MKLKLVAVALISATGLQAIAPGDRIILVKGDREEATYWLSANNNVPIFVDRDKATEGSCTFKVVASVLGGVALFHEQTKKYLTADKYNNSMRMSNDLKAWERFNIIPYGVRVVLQALSNGNYVTGDLNTNAHDISQAQAFNVLAAD